MSNEASNKKLTHVIYGLHALSFLFGITSLVAVIINYAKRADVAGTWLESHFRWQIRTFWWGLLWTVVGFLSSYLIVGYLILVVAAIWYIYRIIKGWIRLNDNREMYTEN